MNSDLNCVLPLVMKPIRYTGGELNSIRPQRVAPPGKADSTVSMALILPDVYEIGMSNYGLRILYRLLNRQPDTVCERAFTPWPDMAERLKQSSTPLHALESKRPLREFNILGFSLQSELSYTNLLYTLDLARIPLRSDERNAGHPLVIAGGPCCANPLPLKPFVDAFVVGDGEEVAGEIAASYRSWNRVNRDDLLSGLARVPGVYVPLKADGRPVFRRVIPELRRSDFPLPPVLPICETVHDRLTLEIARGCMRACRFCQAGILNRPYRSRPIEEIVALADEGVRASGWEEVSLLSLSSLDYPNLLELISRLNASLERRRVAISLPSIRGEDFTPELAQALKQVRKTGLTFAPETGSPRLRALVNKDVAEEKILESAHNAAQAGWGGIKLYFMIGLPGETEADVEEIARFVNEVARTARGSQIRFNLSPFVPKPHTPLQWSGCDTLEALHAKIQRVKFGLQRRSLKAKWENPEVSWLQAILARGDERLALVLEQAYRSGGVFQEWTEHFSLPLWQQAFAHTGVDPETYLRPLPVAEPLPWDFIDVGVSKEFLRREYEKAQAGEMTPDCLAAECSNCGACGPARVVHPESRAAEVRAPEPATRSAEVDYGRYRRKITRREELQVRFRIKYAVGEDYRYAAHLDIVRAFYRALRRSELPVAYTQGFAPRPKVAFGPPLPVGLTSAGEYLDIQMDGHYPGNLIRELGPAMPHDLRLLEARPVLTRVESLGAGLDSARYLISSTGLSEADRNAAQARSLSIPGVQGLEFRKPDEQSTEPTQVSLLLSFAPGVKLFATLEQLFVRDSAAVRCWPAQRLDCYLARDGKLVSPMEEL